MRIVIAVTVLASILAPAVPYAARPADKYENTLAKDFIMDAPWRVVDAQTPIPLTIVLKDCDVDDIRDLHWIRAWDVTAGATLIWDHDFGDETIGDDASEHNFWTWITTVTEGHPSLPDGTRLTPANLGHAAGDAIEIEVQVYYRDDWFNYTESRTLRVHVGGGPFPWPENWYGGDTHYHTMYTNNLYEWGAPLPAVRETALAMGLHWLTATDHSCDLDETGDGSYSYATHQWEWTLQDQGGIHTTTRDVVADGGTWPALGVDAAALSDQAIRIYRGVEINLASVDGDSWEKTLHGLFYNDAGIPSPDSGAPGERPVSPSLTAGLDALSGGGFAYAAHPLSDLSTEVLGLDFGVNGALWGDEDLAAALQRESFRGLEIFNTRRTVYSTDQYDPWHDFDAGVPADDPYPGELLAGVALWDDLLRDDLASGSPRKIFVSGGSDAHGDFNYSSHMSLDDYAEDNGLGKVQTVVYAPGAPAGEVPPQQALLAALRAGRSVATDGPFLEIGLDADGDGDWYGERDVALGGDAARHPDHVGVLHLRWASLPEFGEISAVTLWLVEPGGRTALASYAPAAQGLGLAGGDALDLAGMLPTGWCALRAECLTDDGGAGHRAYTNPVWLRLDTSVAVGDAPARPPRLAIAPNPGNPRAEISFILAADGPVDLTVWSADGRRVRTLARGDTYGAGSHAVTWDGRDEGGRQAASGAYLVRLRADGRMTSGKLTLVR
ncbi:hypothetical protein KJ554_08280 [bacterium]|nr:hypothetical protein [bacterium]